VTNCDEISRNQSQTSRNRSVPHPFAFFLAKGWETLNGIVTHRIWNGLPYFKFDEAIEGWVAAFGNLLRASVTIPGVSTSGSSRGLASPGT
jgi:hypothetical protein